MPAVVTFSAVFEKNDFGLKPLEKQIVSLAVAGFTSRDTSEILAISERSVQMRLIEIYEKLKVSNKLELLLFCIHSGLTDLLELPRPATDPL